MITKADVLNKVKNYQRLNADEKLTMGQKSAIYEMIAKDYTRMKKAQGWKPNEIAAPNFSRIGKRCLTLWACEMIQVASNFVHSIGYSEEDRVLKVVMQDNKYKKVYAYAYHNFPLAKWNAFRAASDYGIFYNRKIKAKYPSVAIV